MRPHHGRSSFSAHARRARSSGKTPLLRHQRGAFAAMTMLLILVICGFCGFAIDLGRMCNRKVELQTVADTIALAAARELDGTTAGVTRARSAAMRVAMNTFYNYNTANIDWSEDAIAFSARADGDAWFDAGSAAQPARATTMFYARVDTSKFPTRPGEVGMLLMNVVSSVASTAHVGSVAIAGRVSIDIMPLAICAMSETRGEARGTELVEYGFRRGISYNLMKLNPNGAAAGANYLVNPFTFPGGAGASVIGSLDVIRPFACTGTLAIPTLAGGPLTVEPDFPLDDLYEQINSRFGTYSAPCNPVTAPPDTNIKQFDAATGFPWMSKPPTGQAAESRTSGNKLLTIADLPASEIPAETTGGMYGPLWVYAPAVIKDSRYVEGAPEPANGYTKFTSAAWPTLYNPGAQQVKTGQTYPQTPYLDKTQAPVGLKATANRRVLNVPLLRCPVTSGAASTADALVVARFFMTVPATETDLYAEFAGLAPVHSLSGQVRLVK